MSFQSFLKTLYNYSFGCCCGSGQLDDTEEQRQLLLETAVDALEYQAYLNKRVRVQVVRVIKFEDSDPDDTEFQDPETENAEAVNVGPVNVEAVNLDPVNVETVNPEAVNLDHVNVEDVNPEAVNIDPVNVETVNVEAKKPEAENAESKQESPKETPEPEAQALPIQNPEPNPELELKVDDSTRRIVNDNYIPGEFNAQVEGKLIQERFALSELEYMNQGSFGKVFRAHDQANHQVKFAVKVVKKIRHDDSWCKDTEGELKVLLEVKHANIVRLLDYFWIKLSNKNEPWCLALKTELLDCDLEDVLQEVGAPLPIPVIVIVAKQLAATLNHLHQEYKIAHHDFKAGNVMVTPFKVSKKEPKDKLIEKLSTSGFKIIDLGFAQKYSGEIRECIEDGFRKGTLMFKSLEKIQEWQSYNPFLADSFAFGVLLLAMMMGYKEFVDEWFYESGKIWDPVTKEQYKPAFNFILKIANRFFKPFKILEPIHQLVLDLLADEPQRWHMYQVVDMLNEL